MQVFVWILGNLAPGKKFYKVKETENSSIFFLIQKCLRTLKIAIFLPKIIFTIFFFFFFSESPTSSKPNHFSPKFVSKSEVLINAFCERQSFIVSHHAYAEQSGWISERGFDFKNWKSKSSVVNQKEMLFLKAAIMNKIL